MSLTSISHFAEYNHFSSPLKLANAGAIPPSYAQGILDFHRGVQQIFMDYFHKEKPSLNEQERFKEHYIIQENPPEITVRVRQTNAEVKDERQKQIILAVASLYHHIQTQPSSLNQVSSPFSIPPEDKEREFKDALEEEGPIHDLTQLDCLDFYPSPVSDKSIPIHILPNEILDHIFSFAIRSWQDMGRIGLTCKSFASVVLHPGCLRRYFQQSPAFYQISSPNLSRRLLDYTQFHPDRLIPRQADLSDKELAIIASQGSQLSSLTLQGGFFTVEGLKGLLQNCPELQTIEFHHCHLDHFDEYISMLGLYAPQLKHLKVIDCPMTDQSLFALAACQLRLLSFEYWNSLSEGKLTDYGLVPFFHSLPYLETVKLTGCLHATENALLALIESTIPSTTEKKGSRLKEAGFSYCGYAGEGLLDSLADNCSKLEKLALGFAPSLCKNDLEYKRQGLIHIFQNCNQLSSVRLSDCTYLDAVTFEMLTLTPIASSLKELELYRCIPLTQIFTENLRKWIKLETFKYEPFNPKKTAEGAPLLPNLACLNLQALSLVGCSLEEDGDQLNSYLKEKGSILKHLELNGCGSFDASLLHDLAENCPALETLELFISPSVNPFNDESLERLARGCPTLRTLQLKSPSRTSCGNFSHHALHTLAKWAPQLRHLTLEGLRLTPLNNAFNNQSSESTEPKPEILGQTESDMRKSLRAFTRRCIHLTHLGLPKSQLNWEEALFLLNAFSAEMRSLDLDQTAWSNQETVIETIAQCKHLQNLQLAATLINQKQLEQAIFPLSQLQYLDIRNCRHLQFASSPPFSFSPSLYVKRSLPLKRL